MNKRDIICEAALDIMHERGIRELTLSNVFERAHTGAGTFYHHFEDREALLDEIYKRCFDIATRELGSEEGLLLSTHERFDDCCQKLLKMYVEYPRESNFLYWYTFGYVEPDNDLCRMTPVIMRLTTVIAQAQEEGLLNKTATPVVMARVVRSMAAGLFWGMQHKSYIVDKSAGMRFAASAWNALSS